MHRKSRRWDRLLELATQVPISTKAGGGPMHGVIWTSSDR